MTNNIKLMWIKLYGEKIKTKNIYTNINAIKPWK